MKNKKKTTIIITVIAVIIIVAGTGIIISQESKKSENEQNESTSVSQQEKDENEASGNSGKSNTESVKKFSFGEIQGNSYYNSFASLTFNLPSDDWKFLSADETAEKYSAKVKDDKAFYTDSNGTGYYDACIADSKTKSTVRLVLYDTNSKKEISDKQQLTSLIEKEEKQHKDFKHSEAYTYKVGSVSYLCSDCVYTEDSREKRSTLAVCKIGEDFVCITTDLIYEYDENLSSDYLSIFREYNI